ncbi:HEAT repeat domain-containing protein [Pseudomonas sp. NPDC089734]|uniref:HEAT repeat domain-containing protein n=1 Tax=Pseudomonas sp. NPDC089734 TaxID=3364469 RepID=UPI0038084D85
MTSTKESGDIAALLEELDVLPTGRERVPLLTRLLLDDRHDHHEDFVFELGLLGDASAVPAIAKAVTIPFPSLVQWDNLHEFQRKCAYALARIGTAESRAVLELMTGSDDPYLREYGEEGLSRWPLK